MDEFRECDDLNQGSKYKHRRTIIHIDLDCFYAQVEILKNPELSAKPVGIKQQHYVITSNYVAREYGIKKCMLITEAIALCPKLIIINGEDLHDYRMMSSKVTDVIKEFSKNVEKLGLDENFIDVTNMVDSKINSKNEMTSVQGHVYKNELESNCPCGCRERLTIGSHIAGDIRRRIREVLGLTSCAGIAHNKLLSKLVCPTHKPNQQTTVFPCSAISLVSNLGCVRAIPGIGRKSSDMLDAMGISSIVDLQNCSLQLLEKYFGKTLGVWIKGACFGVDDSDVKESGKQQVIGLEEAAKMISSVEEVQKRLYSLTERGLVLLEEDGRYPTTLRVTVRKYSSSEDYSRQRESKQCAINPSLLRTSSVKEQICEIAMSLFKKLVDCRKPFHLTLIGLAFTKFLEEMPAKSSLMKFLEKKVDEEFKKPSTSTNDMPNEYKNIVYEPLQKGKDMETITGNCEGTIRTNLGIIDESVLNELPEDIKAEILQTCSKRESEPCSSTSQNTLHCPPGVDVEVFNELPFEIQKELIRDSYQTSSQRLSDSRTSDKKQKSILNYLTKKGKEDR